ncbi:hypothetical protein HQ535_15925, partial [bacterium]|nr:hypothetical protein [bacterium]
MESGDIDIAADSLPEMTVPMHNLTRYLRARVAVFGGVMTWQIPRTLLGIIPIGQRKVEVPVGEIRSLKMNGRTMHPISSLVGMVAVATPWFFLPWQGALLILIIGLWVLVVSLGPGIEASTRRGVT